MLAFLTRSPSRWQYATDFDSSFFAYKFPTALVRRRRWIRVQQLVVETRQPSAPTPSPQSSPLHPDPLSSREAPFDESSARSKLPVEHLFSGPHPWLRGAVEAGAWLVSRPLPSSLQVHKDGMLYKGFTRGPTIRWWACEQRNVRRVVNHVSGRTWLLDKVQLFLLDTRRADYGLSCSHFVGWSMG